MALASLPPGDQRRWLDPTPLLAPALRDSVRTLSPAGQARFANSFWRLADPLLSRPGNGILSEHLARRVEIQFQYAAGFLDGLPWAEDMDETILRYGLPESRIRGMGALFVYDWVEYYLGPPFTVTDLISHYRHSGLELLPPVDGSGVGHGEWDRVTGSPRAGYRVAMGDSVVSWQSRLAHQVAVFRRGNAAVVIAAFDPSAHGVSRETPVDAGLAVVPLDSVIPLPAATYRSGIAAPGPLFIAVEPRPVLMSLELIVPDGRVVSRARHLLDISPFSDGDAGMSDILLFEPGATQPDSLEAALPRVRGSDRVQPGEMIGLFWEMYGLDPAQEPRVSMTLRIASGQAGIVTRLGRILGIVQDENPSVVTWEEEVAAGRRMGRAIVLTVPELPPGTHTIELGATTDGGEQLLSRRTISIGEPVIQPLPDGEMTRRPILSRTLCGSLADDFLMVGNEGNLEVSREIMESSILSTLALEAWMNPPVIGPKGMACKDWVRINPDYFGHGAEHR